MEYIIYEYFIAFFLAFITAFLATPLARKIAFNIGAVDVPKDDRRMHKKPIARLGGLAIISGFLIAIIFYIVGSYFDEYSILRLDKQMLGFLSGALVIAAVCVIDDIKQIRARYKLIFQLAGALIVVVSGTRIINVTNPLSETGMSTLNVFVSYIITILWIVGITNAINLIDGLDGLAAGVSSIASLSLFFTSVIMGDLYTAMITAILAGSTLGFLPYNFNPAKIFMGDTGSNFLGFTLAVVAIQGSMKSYAAIAIAIPLLVLGLPLFDTIFAILRRIAGKKSIMEADRGHLHHRLVDMGLSHKQSVVVMYSVSATLGLCAIVLADKGALSAIILVIALSIFVISGARYMSEITGSQETGEDSLDAAQATGISEVSAEKPDGREIDDVSSELS